MVQNNANRIDVPYVVNLNDLKAYLSDFNDGTHYTTAEMDSIYQTLLAASRDDVTRREHISNIRDTKKSIQNNICPRCGSNMVLREGKYV